MMLPAPLTIGISHDRSRPAPPPPPPLADAGDDLVDPLAQGGRQLEVRVQVVQLLELGAQLLGERREVGDEPDQLVDRAVRP